MDKEHRLLDVLARDAGLSQRQVAKETGFSLGMVNLVLHRLVKTGAIKVVNLNGRAARYILTPKGAAEQTRRAYAYLYRTMGTFRALRMRVDALIAELYEAGAREFIIRGDGEVADIAELCLARTALPGVTHRRVHGAVPPGAEDAGVAVLQCGLEPLGDGYVGVSVLERLVQADAGNVASPERRTAGLEEPPA